MSKILLVSHKCAGFTLFFSLNVRRSFDYLMNELNKASIDCCCGVNGAEQFILYYFSNTLQCMQYC